MNLNNLNWVTVLLLVLNLTEITQLSYWIVFAPTILWAVLLAAVIIFTIGYMIKHEMSIKEFNNLMEENKKNK
ncbi:hypothetical protein AALF85_05330 [Jeotgalicoccus halotolerans]|uniref:hypothetical protein n=1 Tax=Jeotgalicoccus halotolerans TaxID=157227 RepID=UPI0035175676